MENRIPLDAVGSVEILAELNRAKEDLRTVASIAHAGLWELRVADQRLVLSEDTSRILGIRAQDAIPQPETDLDTFLSAVHPDDRPQVSETIRLACEGKAKASIEHRIVESDGGIRHVHLEGRLQHDENGKSFLSGTVHDVTERSVNRERLQQSETLLQIATRITHMGGWRVDLPGRRVAWSDEVAAIHELPAGMEFSVEQCLRFYAPEFRQQMTQAFESCARDGTPYDLDLQIITAKGRRVWVRSVGQAVRDENGCITRVQGAFQDITERKQLEEVRRLADRLNTALDTVSDAFFVLDRQWRFTYLNGQALRLLRRLRDDVLGKVIWEAFEGSAGTPFEHEFRRAMEERHPVKFEACYPPSQAWVECDAYPVREGLVVHFRDVTRRKKAEEAIRESEERFKIIAKATTDVIWDWDLRNDTLWWNEGVKDLFGFSADEMAGGFMSCSDHIHPEDRERVLGSLRDAIEGPDDGWSAEYRFLRKDGAYAEVQDRGFIIRDAGGKAVRMIGSMVDITERNRAEQERRQAEAQIRSQASLLDKAQDAIIVNDIDGRVTFWNKSAERLYGWTAEEALGKRKTDLIVEDRFLYGAAYKTVLERGDWSGEIRKRHKNGTILSCEAHWTLVRDDDGEPQSVLAIDTDITRRKAAELEIERLAFYDPLTRLPNRRLLLDRLERALASARRNTHNGALLFIDLDNFKSLNDTLGHDKGDMLLQQVAQRLEVCVPRKTDTVARFGGDEFVVMLECLSEDPREAGGQAEMVAEKILALFNTAFHIDHHEYHTTPSIGVALFDHQPVNVEELLKRADLAMYQAKAAGRNAIRFFDPEMQTIVSARVALETDLRQGLQQQEFFLQYQRQTDVHRNTIGAEALVRWQHPRRGLVSPALFIPLAEETGLIVRLGEWVMEAACRQLAAWARHPETARLTIAVNVSPRQFRHPEFVQQVISVLERTGADPRNLKLELTETLLVENVESTITKMTSLKERGVSFALDDFGTGYSSLAYLKRLPLDQLKIDQSFVRDVLTDANDAAIARTIVALGQTLGLEVIAEGVETEEQLHFLAQHGCHAYQGYLFSQPSSASQF